MGDRRELRFLTVFVSEFGSLPWGKKEQLRLNSPTSKRRMGQVEQLVKERLNLSSRGDRNAVEVVPVNSHRRREEQLGMIAKWPPKP